MKLVFKALALIAVSFVGVGCGERPLRPKALGLSNGSGNDSVTASSKNVVHIVTTKDLTGKFLIVKVAGDQVASECGGEAVAKLTEGEKYSIARETELQDFGVRGAYVTIEYSAGEPMKAVKFTLLAADGCAEGAPAKEFVVDTVIEPVAKDPGSSDATAAKTYLGFEVVKAEI